ncbi:hypothetical protein ACIBQ1_54960 [Nonomuraea sp. NPDC050153]|uniref:hypothetical protein n=1 Tax=Nonomuraea sp. NPDC050153 TaxID=3364359 RepID=UPI0037A91770
MWQGIVIGCDSMLEVGGFAYGMPKDLCAAAELLNLDVLVDPERAPILDEDVPAAIHLGLADQAANTGFVAGMAGMA